MLAAVHSGDLILWTRGPQCLLYGGVTGRDEGVIVWFVCSNFCHDFVLSSC